MNNMMIKWSDSFAVHIDIVDAQHKKLFDLLNKISDTYNKHNVDEYVLENTIKDLMAYAEKHFTEEEALMETNKIDSRHLSLHRMEHKSFAYDVQKLREHLFIDDDLPQMIENLVCFITSWLTYHILGMDKVMAKQIEVIQHGNSPEEAYQQYHTITYDATVTRLMLTAVLKLWNTSNQRCYKLEEKLTEIIEQQQTYPFLKAISSIPFFTHSSHREYIIDEQGKRTKAVIPIEDYLLLIENLKHLSKLIKH